MSAISERERAGMRIEEQKISDVIAAFPDAEDVLEQAGIDYWFGGDGMLGPSCRAAHVDPGEVASRLAALQPCSKSTPPEKLAALLSAGEDRWREKLAPAIELAMASSGLSRHRAALRLLQQLKERCERHMAANRSLLKLADGIEREDPGILHPNTLRGLRLDHLELARLAGDLRAQAASLDSTEADLATSLRKIVYEVHHHLRVAYDVLLPRLVAAARARATVAEPW